MTRLSIVVPIFNVGPYLDACLASIAAQSVHDFEAILVNDGSTDESDAIATRWSAADSRFRVVHQENHGTGHARNTGLRQARGQYLAFLDGDDLTPPEAYQVLTASLDVTGADFALGNVHRVDSAGTRQAAMYAGLIDGPRPQTHVTAMPSLLADHLAHNKVWRRAFWRARWARFPVGVYYEDVWTMVKMHYRARMVDVLPDIAVLWRSRESGEPSVTQSRASDVRQFADRAAAVRSNSRFFARNGESRLKIAYDTLALNRDLRYYVDLYDQVDDDYRRAIRRLTLQFLRTVDPESLAGVSAVHRVKYELLRQSATVELGEYLAACRAGEIDRAVAEEWLGSRAGLASNSG